MVSIFDTENGKAREEMLLKQIHSQSLCGYCKDIMGEDIPVQDITINDTGYGGITTDLIRIECSCHGSKINYILQKDIFQQGNKKIMFPVVRQSFKLPINNLGYSQLEFGEDDIILRNSTNRFYIIFNRSGLKLIHDQNCILDDNAISKLRTEKPIAAGNINYIKNSEDARLYKLPDNCLKFKAVLLAYEPRVDSDWQRVQSLSFLHESNYWLKLNKYNVNIINYARQHLYDITATPIDL